MRVKLFPNFTRHHLITHTYCNIKSKGRITGYNFSAQFCKETSREQIGPFSLRLNDRPKISQSVKLAAERSRQQIV